MFKPGDIVFFKRGKKNSQRKTPEVQFNGHAFGIMLGHVPPFQKDPPQAHVLRLMATVGFISFDDVGIFLGPEALVDCVKKFELKYYGQQIPVQPNTENLEKLPLKSVLVDVCGKPLES